MSRVLWNGEMFGGSGEVEPNRSAATEPVAVTIPTSRVRSTNELAITLYSSGAYPLRLDDRYIRVGTTSAIYRWRLGGEIFRFFLLGAFVSAGVYHLLLAWYRRTDRQHIYFGLLCLVCSNYWFLSSPARNIFILQPDIRYRIEFASLFASLPLSVLYVSHLSRRRYRWFERSSVAAFILPALMLLSANYEIWKLALRFWEASMLVVVPVAVVICLRERQRAPQVNHLLVGLVVFSLFVLHDIFADLIGSTFRIAHYGFALPILTVAIFSARKAVADDAKIRSLSETLEQKVKSRTKRLLETINQLRSAQRTDKAAKRLAHVLASKGVERKLINNRPFVYESCKMHTAMEAATRYAKLHQPLLILGETGTGKELMARWIHQESQPEAPFVAVNCAAMSDSLWEDEVFGHVEGAFT
ncbi:MAG: sigma 54-interacting transcriptional regulator, partial [Myxococcota bacterium]